MPPAITNMGNPAADYCLSQGGRIEIHKDAAGNESGYCRLPDGSAVEEWELFHRAAPPPSPSPTGPAAGGATDPTFGRNIALVVLAGLAVGAAVYYVEK